jgi:hypothetical protein
MQWFERLRRCDRIVAAGAILLFVFLFFFDWYGTTTTSSLAEIKVVEAHSGWETFTSSRWIWLVTIIVALLAVAVAAGAIKSQGKMPLGTIVASLGGLSTLLILYRILHHPSPSLNSTVFGASFVTSAGIKLGIWLGLCAAVATTYGGYLMMREESDPMPASPATAVAAASQSAAPGEEPATRPSAGGAPATPEPGERPPVEGARGDPSGER